MRVLICDDQAIIREGLALLLGLEPDIEVAGVVEDGAEAVAALERLAPDLVLMDLKMPGLNGIEATRQIRARFPQVRVLVLTTYDDDEWIFDAVRAGAAGYLLKDTPRAELLAAVRGTVAGKSYVDPAVAGRLLAQVADPQVRPPSQVASKLSERELSVLRLLAAGLSNADIAVRLYLSEGTVRNHVSAILTKLDLADRTQAAVLAIQHGLG
jgi:two-component system, NarL family, response regulator LiaR